MKSIIIITLVLVSCVALNEALRCYSHNICSTNCPQLSESIKTCTGDDNKCYKAVIPGGVSRGCGKERCNVQVNANSVLANVCCENDLCNSAKTSKLTLSTLLLVIGAWFMARI